MRVILLLLSLISFMFGRNSGDCYRQRIYFQNKEIVFKALKRTLLESHLNIKTISKKDGIIFAEGAKYNHDKDTITVITISISFNELEKDKVKVNLIASYSTSKKKSDTAQIGASGIVLPIPVPFDSKYSIVGGGNIDDPNWYQGFFNNLDKNILEALMGI